jgi:hypothetical protein
MGVDIRIMYKLKSNDNWITLKFTPEQYFDTNMEPVEEEYEVDSIPRFLDIRDYLKEPDENIININVFLKDIEKNAEISFYCSYWNNGKNFLVEKKDKTSSKLYHLIIIDLEIDQYTYEILKFLVENGTMRPIGHTRISGTTEIRARLGYLCLYIDEVR